MNTKPCRTCGVPFVFSHTRKTFCSQECYFASMRGKPGRLHTEETKRKFCEIAQARSPAHYIRKPISDEARKHQCEAQSRRWAHVPKEHTCSFCGSVFKHRPGGTNKFCTKSCYARFQRGTVPHPVTDQFRSNVSAAAKRRYAHIPKTLLCDGCGSVFPRPRWGYQKFCSHACFVAFGNTARRSFLRGKHVRSTDGVAVSYSSSYEKRMMELLDSVGISWVRPNWGFPWKYIDGTTHKYFPDFYLPEERVYIETKGYVTDRDQLKWAQFPADLVVVGKDDMSLLEQEIPHA